MNLPFFLDQPVELLALPADGLTFQAGLGLIDAEYSELELTGLDLEGNEPVSSPEINFNIAADYEFDISANWMTRLPGHSYQGDDPDGYMHKDEVTSFLTQYAHQIDAPLRGHAPVHASPV